MANQNPLATNLTLEQQKNLFGNAYLNMLWHCPTDLRFHYWVHLPDYYYDEEEQIYYGSVEYPMNVPDAAVAYSNISFADRNDDGEFSYNSLLLGVYRRKRSDGEHATAVTLFNAPALTDESRKAREAAVRHVIEAAAEQELFADEDDPTEGAASAPAAAPVTEETPAVPVEEAPAEPDEEPETPAETCAETEEASAETQEPSAAEAPEAQEPAGEEAAAQEEA